MSRVLRMVEETQAGPLISQRSEQRELENNTEWRRTGRGDRHRQGGGPAFCGSRSSPPPHTHSVEFTKPLKS